ncbi:MAG: precorrin-2 dehydrogenase/sirohydrochlorin ferrochelatase family protein [Chloroflexota bacterium]
MAGGKISGIMVRYYPMMLSLAGRTCVVVGGGEVAARKVGPLLECEALVRVVSPVVVPQLQQLADAGVVALLLRAFRPGDLTGAVLAIAATDDASTNEAVWQEARATGLPVNVVDDPARCTFTVPAAVRRGPLLLTVSTDGTSPALARAVRQQLAREFGPAWGRFASWLGEVREQVKAEFPTPNSRERVWRELLDEEVLALLRADAEQQARERVQAKLTRLAADRADASRVED